jgi:hypothetical protein
VYCSGLREIDAIMGDDEKLIAKVLSAQKSINADMIAIVGSPVPMIVGCDVAGIAHEIEERAGVPSFGFDTTGLRYYDYGVSIACDALVKRFVRPCAKSSEPSVNILGADTIDFGITPTIASLRRLLAESGYSCSAVMPCGLSLDTLTNMTAAHVNLVVSRSGLSTAKLLHDRYGIPYLVGLPYGEKCIPEYFGMLEQVRRSGVNAVYGISSDNSSLRKAENGGGVLVIGEQVACNAIRMAVEKDGDRACHCGLPVRNGTGTMPSVRRESRRREGNFRGDQRQSVFDRVRGSVPEMAASECIETVFSDSPLRSIQQNPRSRSR